MGMRNWRKVSTVRTGWDRGPPLRTLARAARAERAIRMPAPAVHKRNWSLPRREAAAPWAKVPAARMAVSQDAQENELS